MKLNTITRTRQSRNGTRSCTESQAQSPHFTTSPRHESAHGIGTQSQSFAHSGREGNDIFDGAANFDAHDIFGGETAKAVVRQEGGQIPGEEQVFRSNDDGCRDTIANFLGKGGS